MELKYDSIFWNLSQEELYLFQTVSRMKTVVENPVIKDNQLLSWLTIDNQGNQNQAWLLTAPKTHER